MEVPDGRVPTAPRGHSAGPFHRLGRCRPLPALYTEVLGGRLAFSGPGGLTYVALSNSWIIINVGGGPTGDKPAVILETPRDPDRVSSFLNDIQAVYAEGSARGAQFLTPPNDRSAARRLPGSAASAT